MIKVPTENKKMKLYTLKLTDVHNDFDFHTNLENLLNKAVNEGYEPLIVQELTRPSAAPYIVVIAKHKN